MKLQVWVPKVRN